MPLQTKREKVFFFVGSTIKQTRKVDEDCQFLTSREQRWCISNKSKYVCNAKWPDSIAWGLGIQKGRDRGEYGCRAAGVGLPVKIHKKCWSKWAKKYPINLCVAPSVLVQPLTVSDIATIQRWKYKTVDGLLARALVCCCPCVYLSSFFLPPCVSLPRYVSFCVWSGRGHPSPEHLGQSRHLLFITSSSVV